MAIHTIHGVGVGLVIHDLQTGSNFGDEVVGAGQTLDQVLHVVALAADQAAQVQHDTAGLVPLPGDGVVGVLQGAELLLVPLALTLQLLGDLLLEDKCLKSIITLLLGASEADRHACSIVLLLVDEARQAAVLALVAVNLGLEVLCLLGKLLGECLELEELWEKMLVNGTS